MHLTQPKMKLNFVFDYKAESLGNYQIFGKKRTFFNETKFTFKNTQQKTKLKQSRKHRKFSNSWLKRKIFLMTEKRTI